MRVEADYEILLYSMIALVAVIALALTNIPRKPYKILLAFTVAISMPAFIPGHGEVVMLVPTGAMFTVLSTEVKVIGAVFMIINYFIAWFFLYRIGGLFQGGR